MNAPRRPWSLVAAGLAAALAACSSSSTPAPTPDAAPAVVDAAAATVDAPVPSALANVDVSVAYAGVKQGSLIVAAFRNFPPAGPPTAFQSVATPVFPATVQLRDLEAGTYYVVAILDVAPASPTNPGPEDLQAVSAPVTLAGTSQAASLTLVDR